MIEGFKSIRRLEGLELRDKNLLIGANGAGKSNFVSFFKLLREMVEQRLEAFVREEGGADSMLFMGPQETKALKCKLAFGDEGYQFSIMPTRENQFYFREESVTWCPPGQVEKRNVLAVGHSESRLKNQKADSTLTAGWKIAQSSISSWVVYHFHDTGPKSPVRRQGAINDNEVFRGDAQNLAAFLFRIKTTHPESYSRATNLTTSRSPVGRPNI